MVKLVSKTIAILSLTGAFVLISISAIAGLDAEDETRQARMIGKSDFENGDLISLYASKFFQPNKIKAPKRSINLGIDGTAIVNDLIAGHYRRVLRHISDDVVFQLTGSSKKDLIQFVKDWRAAYEKENGKLTRNREIVQIAAKAIGQLEIRNFGAKYPNVLIISKENNEYASMAFALKKRKGYWYVTEVLRLTLDGKVQSFAGKRGREKSRIKFKQAKRRLSNK